MWRPTSRFTSSVGPILGLLLACVPARAWAQACCAGGSAVTPGRLEVHEDALVGVQLKASSMIGSYDTGGAFAVPGAGEAEQDFEEDLIGAVRVLRRGQVALLVPFAETRRADSLDGGQIGGGVGDINVSARYDFVVAGESRSVPGIALLGGITFPTGKPTEQATPPLQVDATGIGAYQANAGFLSVVASDSQDLVG